MICAPTMARIIIWRYSRTQGWSRPYNGRRTSCHCANCYRIGSSVHQDWRWMGLTFGKSIGRWSMECWMSCASVPNWKRMKHRRRSMWMTGNESANCLIRYSMSTNIMHWWHVATDGSNIKHCRARWWFRCTGTSHGSISHFRFCYFWWTLTRSSPNGEVSVTLQIWATRAKCRKKQDFVISFTDTENLTGLKSSC